MGDKGAALYIRLSREDEGDGPSQSVTNQQTLLESYAREQHLTVFDTYIDDGWSGTNFDRPAFRRMIRDIEAGKVNLVITKDLSRLGRDYILTGHYMERYFPEHRVRYISLLDGIDTGVESTANDITPFRAIMNDMYAKDISRKIKSVKRDKQRRGQFIGGKPCYGYRMHPEEKNRIVIDEAAASVVRRIFSLALTGKSCRSIAALLNEEGILSPGAYWGRQTRHPGPYAGLWSSERIAEMLRNEIYIGNMVQGRTVKVSYKSQRCFRQPRENWVVVPGTHTAIIDPETFRRVGFQLDSRRHTRHRTYDFLLKGRIFCRECGYPLGVLNRKNRAGEDRLFFVCRTYQRFTKAGVCTCHSIKEERVNRAVTETLRQICEGNWDREALLPIAMELLAAKNGARDRTEELGHLETKIGELTAHLDRVYRDRLAGILGEEDFARIYRGLVAERDALRERQHRLAQAQRDVDPGIRAGELVVAFEKNLFSRREVLVSLVERAELSENKEIRLKLRFLRPECLQ